MYAFCVFRGNQCFGVQRPSGRDEPLQVGESGDSDPRGLTVGRLPFHDRVDPGDGLLFRVVVEEADGKRTEIANRQVSAHAWYALEGSLAPWAGKPVTLLLITDVGEKDNSSGDWGAWAELRLERP